MKNTVLALSAILAFSAVSAQAETVVADADGNGTFSMEELMVSFPDLTAEAFAAVDANADGAVDADELKAAVEAGLLPE